MFKRFKQFAVFTGIVAIALAVPGAASADEWEERSSFYEDDAWYDITEWLDGNDYNPTDESAGVWNDEVYDTAAVETDVDNDWYGYDDVNEDDNWYYDYYDDNYAYYDSDLDDDAFYDRTYTYYDFDNDAYYDAYSVAYDSDGDGLFDDYNYVSFNDSTGSDAKSTPQADKKASAKPTSVTGTVESTKTVKVRGGDRIVARVEASGGKTFVVDLGASKQGQDVKQGQQITASGPLVQVGEKQILLAQMLKVGGGQEQQIDRSGRELSGTVAKMKTAKVRDQKNQMVILNLEAGKQIVVDLGPADKLNLQLSDGDQLDVRGIPVKVKDKAVIVANSVTKDGNTVQIKRSGKKEKDLASS